MIMCSDMHKPGQLCDSLVECTATALNDDAVAIMLIAVQRANLEMSISLSVKR